MTGSERGDLLHSLPAQQIARRIGRGVDQNGLGARMDHFTDGGWRVLETLVFMDWDADRFPSEETDEIGITGVVGIGDDDLIIPFENRREKDHHGR
jgi:hypothetical protein